MESSGLSVGHYNYIPTDSEGSLGCGPKKLKKSRLGRNWGGARGADRAGSLERRRSRKRGEARWDGLRHRGRRPTPSRRPGGLRLNCSNRRNDCAAVRSEMPSVLNAFARFREGEVPSEPAKSFAAQQELRRPKTHATELGRGSVRAGNGLRGSAGASPSQKPGPRNLGGRGSEPAMAIAAQQELRPPEIRQRSISAQTLPHGRCPGATLPGARSDDTAFSMESDLTHRQDRDCGGSGPPIAASHRCAILRCAAESAEFGPRPSRLGGR